MTNTLEIAKHNAKIKSAESNNAWNVIRYKCGTYGICDDTFFGKIAGAELMSTYSGGKLFWSDISNDQ